MKTLSMSGSLRESVGKKDAKTLRRNGDVPCVLYGGEKQKHFKMAEVEFKPLLFTADAHFVELNIDGEKSLAILQDIQYHPISDRVIHADFFELNDNKSIIMSIPVLTKGTARGVLDGGKLDLKKRVLKLRALPGDMPQYVELDIAKLRILDSIKVKDINIPDVEILENRANIVVQVRSTRNTGDSVGGGADDAAEGNTDAETKAE